jgi:hypothetical protein
MAVEAEAGSSEPPSLDRDEEGGRELRRGGWTAWLVRGGKKRVKLPVSASPGGKGKESVVDRAVAKDAAASSSGCLGRMRARGTILRLVYVRVSRATSKAWSRKVARWSANWRKMGTSSNRVSPTRDLMGETAPRREDDDDAEDADDISPVRPFDHRAIVALSPQGGSPPLIFGGAATTPVRGRTDGRTNDGETDERISGRTTTTTPGAVQQTPRGGFQTPRGTHVAMASLASGGGIGRRTLGGIDASTSKKPMSTQSNKPMRHRGAEYLSPNPPTHDVYSDSDSDGDDKENIYANGVNLNLVNRGNKTPVGFRLYDGLRSRTASSNQFPENDDDEVPTVSPIAAALASLPPFVVNREHGTDERRLPLSERKETDWSSNSSATKRTPLGDKSLIRATSGSSLAILRAATPSSSCGPVHTPSSRQGFVSPTTSQPRGDEVREMELFVALEELVSSH